MEPEGTPHGDRPALGPAYGEALRAGGELGEQPRLSESRLADDPGDRAAAARQIADQAAQDAELALPADVLGEQRRAAGEPRAIDAFAIRAKLPRFSDRLALARAEPHGLEREVTRGHAMRARSHPDLTGRRDVLQL